MNTNTTGYDDDPERPMDRNEHLYDLLCRAHFGESLSASDRAELEGALAASEELRTARVELEATATLVRETLAPASDVLGAERRSAVLAAAGAGPPVARRPLLLRSTWFPLAAAGMIGVAGAAWWTLRTPEQVTVDFARGMTVGPATVPELDLAQESPVDEAPVALGGLDAIGYSSAGSADSVVSTDGFEVFTVGSASSIGGDAAGAWVRYVGRGGAVSGVPVLELSDSETLPSQVDRGVSASRTWSGQAVRGVAVGGGLVDFPFPVDPLSTSDESFFGRATKSRREGGDYRGPGDSVPPPVSGAPVRPRGEAGAEVSSPPDAGVTSFGLAVLEADANGVLILKDEGPALELPSEFEFAGQALLQLGRAGNASAFDGAFTYPGQPDGSARPGVRRIPGSAHRALQCEPRPLPSERPRDMFFRFWGDNPFVVTDSDALSTFAADVDTASFALAERMLREGHVPARAQIRTEEFVNFAKPDLAPPAEGTFRIHGELSPSPFGGREDRYLLRVGVRAKEVARDERPPLALTFVVDVSGSMAEQNRLELVKHALRLLTSQLDARDTIAIVAFSNDAREVLRATPATMTDVIETALFGLHPSGGTNADAGITLGYHLAAQDADTEAQRRVVFLSDGVANIGQTDQDAIARRVVASVGNGVFLNTIGVGLGNHNDVFLEQLADKGQGICDYISDAASARRAIVDRFTGGFVTVAQDVKIQVEFDPAVVLRWRQLGYENRAVADRDFRNDKIDAGEVGAGHQVTCLYEIELASTDAARETPLATARVRYRTVDASRVGSEAVEIEHGVRYAAAAATTFRGASQGFRRAALAAQLAEILRASVHTAGDSLQALGLECAQLLSEDMAEDTARIAELVKRSLDLGIRSRPALAGTDPDAAHRRAYYESLIESLGGKATSDAQAPKDAETAESYEIQIRDLLKRIHQGKDD